MDPGYKIEEPRPEPPAPYETRVRCYGPYATRRRLWWRRQGVVPEGARGASAQNSVQSPAAAPADDACAGAMHIVAFVTAQQAVRKILAQLDARDSIRAPGHGRARRRDAERGGPNPPFHDPTIWPPAV